VLDKETKEPASELGGQLGARFMAETGVIARNIENTLIFSPPLTFTTEDCDAVADAVNTMLAKYGN
jgi:adenosylmethionine-8-amino-7-oxononanoate aminotransferase